MPITTKQRKPNGYVTLRTSNTETVFLNGATNGANSTPDETVSSMTVAEIMWSVSSDGSWQISRGANTLVNLYGSGHHDYQANGIKIELNDSEETANCVATLTGGTGSIVVKLHKKSGE